MFPPGFPFNPMFFQPPQEQHDHGSTEVPARVRAALVFLQNLTHKTSKTVVPLSAPGVDGGTLDVKVVKGQALTDGEVDAQEAACRLLINYFDGELKVNQFEAATLPGNNPAQQAQMNSANVISCPWCKGKGCQACFGKGRVYSVDLRE